MLVERAADGVDRLRDMFPRHRQRRFEPENIPRLGRRLHDDPAFEQNDGQPVADEDLREFLDAGCELDGYQQPASTNVSDERMTAQPLPETAEKLLPTLAAVRAERIVLDDPQRFHGRGAGEGVARKRGSVQI